MVPDLTYAEWGLLIGLSGWLLRQFVFSEYALRRRALRGATTRIADARQGVRLKLAGRVRPGGKLLTAPLSQRPCCAYRIRIIVNGEDSYEVVRDEVSGTDCYLEDESGRALLPLSVESRISLVLAEEQSVDLKKLAKLDSTMVALLSARGIDLKKIKELLQGSREVTVIESVVVAGMALTVVAQSHPTSDAPHSQKGGIRPPQCTLRAAPTLLLTNDTFKAIWGSRALW